MRRAICDAQHATNAMQHATCDAHLATYDSGARRGTTCSIHHTNAAHATTQTRLKTSSPSLYCRSSSCAAHCALGPDFLLVVRKTLVQFSDALPPRQLPIIRCATKQSSPALVSAIACDPNANARPRTRPRAQVQSDFQCLRASACARARVAVCRAAVASFAQVEVRHAIIFGATTCLLHSVAAHGSVLDRLCRVEHVDASEVEQRRLGLRRTVVRACVRARWQSGTGAQSRRRYGGVEPSPGTDVLALSPVPVQI